MLGSRRSDHANCDIMKLPNKLPRASTVPTSKPQRTFDELAHLAGDVFDRQLRPALRPEDHGKFVAVNVDTGDYEIDEDDYTAVTRLLLRNPAADTWLLRAGCAATCRI
jgi:hypothetical protein